jgi:hypothetical protein
MLYQAISLHLAELVRNHDTLGSVLHCCQDQGQSFLRPPNSRPCRRFPVLHLRGALEIRQKLSRQEARFEHGLQNPPLKGVLERVEYSELEQKNGNPKRRKEMSSRCPNEILGSECVAKMMKLFTDGRSPLGKAGFQHGEKSRRERAIVNALFDNDPV